LLASGGRLYRAGEIIRSDPISSLDQVVVRSHATRQAGHPGPTRPIGFSSFKNYGSGLAKLAVAIHHVDVDDVIVINLQNVNLQHKLAAAVAASVGYDIFAIAYGRIRLIRTDEKKRSPLELSTRIEV
jgi:hypothetical protein